MPTSVSFKKYVVPALALLISFTLSVYIAANSIVFAEEVDGGTATVVAGEEMFSPADDPPADAPADTPADPPAGEGTSAGATSSSDGSGEMGGDGSTSTEGTGGGGTVEGAGTTTETTEGSGGVETSDGTDGSGAADGETGTTGDEAVIEAEPIVDNGGEGGGATEGGVDAPGEPAGGSDEGNETPPADGSDAGGDTSDGSGGAVTEGGNSEDDILSGDTGTGDAPTENDGTPDDGAVVFGETADAAGAEVGEGGEGGSGEVAPPEDLPPVGEDGTSGLDGIDGEDSSPDDGSGAGGTITTGDAAAHADVVNLINTTILDSRGMIAFLNLFAPYIGNIDISQFDFYDNAACERGRCERLEGDRHAGSSLDATNDGDATNEVTVAVSTGENTATDPGGEIDTGDSAAVANVANLVNTTIADSNYLLLVINSFDDLVGDVVLPGQGFFMRYLGRFLGQRGTPTTLPLIDNSSLNDEGAGTFKDENGVGEMMPSLEAENTAAVTNNSDTVADTGDNTAGGGSIVETGDATALANVVNEVNGTYYNQDQIYILVQVFGEWTGEVFGVPPGVTWKETPHGIVLYGDPASFAGLEGGAGVAGSGCCGAGGITLGNTANIMNNVSVYALTGENNVGADSRIRTGDATAVSNLFNMANTTIVGSNWITGLINVFGDWDGNLAFGRPDLLTLLSATVSSNPLKPGGTITYTIDVLNKGTSQATNVGVRTTYLPNTVLRHRSGGTISAAATAASEHGGDMYWSIGTIPAGESRSVSYAADVLENLPQGVGMIKTVAAAEMRETDANPSDNTDSLAFAIGNPNSGFSPRRQEVLGGGAYGSGRPRLSLSKAAEVEGNISPGDVIGYTIELDNNGSGSVFQAVLSDVLYDPLGEVMSVNNWDLDVVYPWENVDVTYNAEFAEDAPSGWYINVAFLEGINGYQEQIPQTETWSYVYLVNPLDQPKDPVTGVPSPPPPPPTEPPLENLSVPPRDLGGADEGVVLAAGVVPDAPVPPDASLLASLWYSGFWLSNWPLTLLLGLFAGLFFLLSVIRQGREGK